MDEGRNMAEIKLKKREEAEKEGLLTADQVGATKNYLLHAGLSGNGTICTKKAIIKQSTLISGGSKGMVRTI